MYSLRLRMYYWHEALLYCPLSIFIAAILMRLTSFSKKADKVMTTISSYMPVCISICACSPLPISSVSVTGGKGGFHIHMLPLSSHVSRSSCSPSQSDCLRCIEGLPLSLSFSVHSPHRQFNRGLRQRGEKENEPQ